MGFAAGKSWEEIDNDYSDYKPASYIEHLTERQIRNRFEKAYPTANLKKDKNNNYVNFTTDRYYRVFRKGFEVLGVIKK